MGRVVKEHAVRRTEIVDSAQRLMNTKGYEQMTIQDILDDLQISKGAFYHYFDSKQTLLGAIIDRMIDAGEQILVPILENGQLSAIEKLQQFFESAGRWKTAQKGLILALMKVWYGDENAVARQRVYVETAKRFAPLLTEIIRQGIQEGRMTTPYADDVAEVILTLEYGFGDKMAQLLLSSEPTDYILRRMEAMVAVYTDAHERVLGIASGTLQMVNLETLKQWAVNPEDRP